MRVMVSEHLHTWLRYQSDSGDTFQLNINMHEKKFFFCTNFAFPAWKDWTDTVHINILLLSHFTIGPNVQISILKNPKVFIFQKTKWDKILVVFLIFQDFVLSPSIPVSSTEWFWHNYIVFTLWKSDNI